MQNNIVLYCNFILDKLSSIIQKKTNRRGLLIKLDMA